MVKIQLDWHLPKTLKPQQLQKEDAVVWSDKNLREFNPIMRQSDQLEFMKNHKEEAIQTKNGYNMYMKS